MRHYYYLQDILVNFHKTRTNVLTFFHLMRDISIEKSSQQDRKNSRKRQSGSGRFSGHKWSFLGCFHHRTYKCIKKKESKERDRKVDNIYAGKTNGNSKH